MSCDGGNTWKPTGSGYLTAAATSLVRHQESLLATAHGTIARSQDGGKTWVPWAGNLEGENRISRIGQSGASLFAWNLKDTVHRSLDGGISWTPLGIPNANGIRAGSTNAVAGIGGTLFAAVSDGLRISADSGRAWKRYPLGLMQGPIVSLDVRKHMFVAFTGQGIFGSQDSGATWRAALSGDMTTNWTAFAGAGGLHAAGSQDGQIHASIDSGGSWSASGRIPTASAVISLAVTGKTIFAGTIDGLWSQRERGAVVVRNSRFPPTMRPGFSSREVIRFSSAPMPISGACARTEPSWIAQRDSCLSISKGFGRWRIARMPSHAMDPCTNGRPRTLPGPRWRGSPDSPSPLPAPANTGCSPLRTACSDRRMRD